MADDRDKVAVCEVVKEKSGNKFANDGSFLEMFKKKMAEQNADKEKKSQTDVNNDDSPENSSMVDDRSSGEKMEKTNITSLVGKRRSGSGAKVLKTGIVKKPKQDEDSPDETKDGWSKYMAEVNKYKSKICTDEDKTRPLVK